MPGNGRATSERTQLPFHAGRLVGVSSGAPGRLRGRCRRVSARLRMLRVSGTAFDHAEGVATVGPPLAAQLVHDGTHEENTPTPDADFSWIEVGHCQQVEGLALVVDMDFDAVGHEKTLDLHGG